MADSDHENPPKRRRLDHECAPSQHAHDLLPKPAMDARDKDDCEQMVLPSKHGKDGSSAIASNSKHAAKAVASFLSEHIPQQYAAHGDGLGIGTPPARDPNTKYCYRHRPDLKCRRIVDEEGMDQLQQVPISTCKPFLLPLTILGRSSSASHRTTSRTSRTCGRSSRPRRPRTAR